MSTLHLSKLSCFMLNQEVDIAHRCAGNGNIDYEYTSPDNPRFILHDSQGFEAVRPTTGSLLKHFFAVRIH